ncbi:BamA/TamA family outer membrane protein [Alistipes sp.]|uniref:BamA/TamA family outer membrane protein n=1 Tax=Alistipes sp. TaxID=1872444 RepID=UPI003AF0739B
MLRTLLLSLLLCTVLRGQAQEGIYVEAGDTLRYTYTPLEPLPETDSVVQTPARRNFLRRIVDYFGDATVDRTFEKKIDFTFAGGPSYSKNTSFGIGLLAAGLYRIDRTDSVTQPSNISIFGNVSVSGFYALGVTGNNIWDHNKQRINYSVVFSSAPRSLWGVGYEEARNNDESTYVEKNYRVDGTYLHRVLPYTYLGALVSFQHTRGLKFTDESYLHGEKHRYTATGLGAVAEYDSRDFIPNPQEGLYVSFKEVFYPKGLGTCGKSLWRTTFTADSYHALWKGGILATDLYAEFNSAGTPWPMLARMGGSYRMRGYYEGRYTDNDMITFQVELRQRIWRRIGCTVWAGAGNVFEQLARFDWSHTLPNYGVGFRWELKKRVNVRIDYGFGKNTSGFLLNVNEAF